MGDIMYTVEKIEEDIVVLEDRVTKEIINVNIENFDYNIKVNDIVKFDANSNLYVKVDNETEKVKINLRSRFNKLKR